MCCRRLLFAFLAVVLLLTAVTVYLDDSRHWVFDPVTLQAIAKRSIKKMKDTHQGKATTQHVIDEVLAEVKRVYPNYVNITNRWIFNNAGGAMGAMTVLHCSFTEYLIIFGTPIGTEGHTGRFFAEDFFTILDGEQWAALPGATEREVYRPGDQHYLPLRTAKQYAMPDKCFALEYARGNILSMMLFGFADSISSTLDLATMYHTVLASAGNMLHNTMNGKF